MLTRFVILMSCLSARNCLNQHCQCSYHHPFLGRRKVGLWDAIWHPISLTRWKYWMLWTKKKCPQVNTYTIEVSMLGYEDHDSRQIVPYTDDLYAKVSLKFQSWPGFPGWAEHNTSLLGLLQDCGRHSAGGWWNTWQCDRANSTTPPNNWWHSYYIDFSSRILQTMSVGSRSHPGTCPAAQNLRR